MLKRVHGFGFAMSAISRFCAGGVKKLEFVTTLLGLVRTVPTPENYEWPPVLGLVRTVVPGLRHVL